MESFLKKGNIVLQFEIKYLMVYVFKSLEKYQWYKWMLKSFSITFVREGDIL